LFAKLGIAADDIRALADLKQLPILTKADIRANYAELLSEAVPRRARRTAHTSGTTGGGMRFAVTQEALDEQWATWWRYRRWHGLELGTWCGYFGGRSIVPVSVQQPPFWRVNVPGRQIMFSAYHLAPQNMPSYVGELRRRKPPWLHGYPSLLALLAAHLVETGSSLDYQVRWITTGAENLMPQQAALIERAFGVRPVQHYGMSEGVANVSQFTDGRLYVDEDFAVVEFLPDPGGGHRIIGTNLSNAALPLLRYEVGDIAQLPLGEQPAAGFPGREVIRVDGRREDYVILANGARIGRLDHVFKDLTMIREAQIVQNTPGAIVVRVVRGADYGERHESLLLHELRQRLGEDTGVQIEYVERIARTASGKLRFVISNLAAGQLLQHVEQG
jgi:phenylacetate-CoA ligase